MFGTPRVLQIEKRKRRNKKTSVPLKEKRGSKNDTPQPTKKNGRNVGQREEPAKKGGEGEHKRNWFWGEKKNTDKLNSRGSYTLFAPRKATGKKGEKGIIQPHKNYEKKQIAIIPNALETMQQPPKAVTESRHVRLLFWDVAAKKTLLSRTKGGRGIRWG